MASEKTVAGYEARGRQDGHGDAAAGCRSGASRDAAKTSAAAPRTPDEIEAALQAQAAAQTTWQVAENFCSINGEGPKAGRLAAFIRFAGCNLDCGWCDTRWANRAGVDTHEMTLADMVSFISASGAECVTLTGGEPLLQHDVQLLIAGLLAADPDWSIEFETNGSVDLAPAMTARHAWGHRRANALLGEDDGQVLSRLNRRNVFNREAARVSFTMDWKLPSSGMEDRMLPDNLELLGAEDALKFVVGTEEDLRRALEVLDEHDLRERDNVFFSPVFGMMDPADIVRFLQENRLARARVQLQLHKIIWPDVEKGV